MNRQQYAAVLRLQLYTIGEVHTVMGEFSQQAVEIVRAAGDADTPMAAGKAAGIMREIRRAWAPALADLTSLVSTARREAACIPLGVLAIQHKKIMTTPAAKRARAAAGQAEVYVSDPAAAALFQEATDDPPNVDPDAVDYVFQPQLEAILRASRNRVKGGVPLSSRIWRLDENSVAGINGVLTTGIAQGKSAWDIAKLLEPFLGAGKDCPRWTRTRLYSRTKKQIAAGDRTGLISGADCNGQGVSYNALRMARTEIQHVHSAATEELMREAPWIEKEKINLSPAHPVEDICDEIIRDGENGEGIYPIGEISLPVHPNCLCFKTAIQQPNDDFVQQLRGWMKGDSDWPAMDSYAASLGEVLDPPIRRGVSEAARPAAVARPHEGPSYIGAFGAWFSGKEGALDQRMKYR